MALETSGDSNGDLNSRGRCRWTENRKVYTRRIRKKQPQITYHIPDTATTGHNADDTLNESLRRHEECLSPGPSPSESDLTIRNRLQKGSVGEGAELRNPEDSPLAPSNEAKKFGKVSPSGKEIGLPEMVGDSPPYLNERAVNMSPLRETQNHGEQMPSLCQIPQGNGRAGVNGYVRPLVVSRVDDRIRFSLCKATPKDEVMDLRKKLECELDQVRGLVKQVELRQSQIASHSTQISDSILSNNSNYIGPEDADIGLYCHPQHQHHALVKMNMTGHQETRSNGLMRVKSDMGVRRNLEPRSYSRQLSVAVMENNEYVEKEKRTPKANQYYRNSEFLLGKDRLPPESNKRMKTSNRRRGGNGDTERAFGSVFDKSKNQVFRRCSSLLQRLMKHKYGWVFNEPVDAKALGLFDYHDIIKHPMDLGTIKTRMAQNWYKSPRQFAEDVRLVFYNAMTYNPQGQDVHVMAEQLLQIFEDRWAVIENEYNHYSRYQKYSDGVSFTPTSRKAAPQSHFGPPVAVAVAPTPSIHGFVPASMHAAYPTPAAPQIRTSDRSEPIPTVMAVDPKIQRPRIGRIPAPNKPKAKDPDKRDMTYEEKQKLSNNLQGLPHEKLDAIVQIIKKRNTALSQHDDEIEVDIDSVDPETLWELDRFVTNYKKSLSKNKRKAELALQARMANHHNAVSENSNPALANSQMKSGAAFENMSAPVEGERQGYSGSLSSSSSSSSSDSGSSSSDSDSDSSSADGSDAGNSPGT